MGQIVDFIEVRRFISVLLNSDRYKESVLVSSSPLDPQIIHQLSNRKSLKSVDKQILLLNDHKILL